MGDVVPMGLGIERAYCDGARCGGFTATRPDGSQWGWHKADCPRLSAMHHHNEDVRRGRVSRGLALVERLDDAVLDRPRPPARKPLKLWQVYLSVLAIMLFVVGSWYLFVSWLSSL